jgi:hypothetical protein
MEAPLDKLAAYHEAGHTVMVLDSGMAFHSVSISPMNSACGSLKGCRNCATVDDAFRVIMAGYVACRILCHRSELPAGFARTGTEGDFRKIVWLAKRTGRKPSEVDDQWLWTLRRLLQPLLWRQVERVAEALLEKGRLTIRDVQDILSALMVRHRTDE